MQTSLHFSIITPSYNQGQFIERTIRSVLSQAGPAVEYLVIDGGSTDETVSILQSYDADLKWVSEADEGQADAVNKGLERASGDIIGWLNSDDLYYPGAIQAVRTFFSRHPEVDVLYGDAHHIDKSDHIIDTYYTEPFDPHRLEDICFLCQPTVFFRRRVLDRCGSLDASLQYCMDYEYWLRLSGAGMRFGYLRRYLAGSRLYADNKTLGQRVNVHAEINSMLRSRLRRVPDRWLSNYAHVYFEEAGLSRDQSELRFALATAGLSWWASLRWNQRLSGDLLRDSWGWIRASMKNNHNGHSTKATPDAISTIPGPRAAVRRIGFDVSQTGTEKAGCGWVADSLIHHLTGLDEHSLYQLHSSFGDGFWDPQGPDATRRIERHNVVAGLTHATHHEARNFWQDPRQDLEVQLGYPDLVHSNNFYCPTRLGTARLVFTLYDLHFLDHPEWTTERNRQTCFDGVFAASLHADLVIAISEATKNHFLRVFPHYPQERVEVVHLGCRLRDLPAIPTPASLAHLEGRRFLLNVGTLEPRKNQARLLEAFASFIDTSDEPLSLVLAGGSGWLNHDIEHWLTDPRLNGHVERLGYVSDSELVWLYRNCFAFVYPSLAEGFGLPVIEAAQQGAPVIASREPAIEEVAGDAALFVDPRSSNDIRAAIEKLVNDEELRCRLGEIARTHAKQYSWERSAKRVLELYDGVLQMEKYVGRTVCP